MRNSLWRFDSTSQEPNASPSGSCGWDVAITPPLLLPTVILGKKPVRGSMLLWEEDNVQGVYRLSTVRSLMLQSSKFPDKKVTPQSAAIYTPAKCMTLRIMASRFLKLCHMEVYGFKLSFHLKLKQKTGICGWLPECALARLCKVQTLKLKPYIIW